LHCPPPFGLSPQACPPKTLRVKRRRSTSFCYSRLGLHIFPFPPSVASFFPPRRAHVAVFSLCPPVLACRSGCLFGRGLCGPSFDPPSCFRSHFFFEIGTFFSSFFPNLFLCLPGVGMLLFPATSPVTTLGWTCFWPPLCKNTGPPWHHNYRGPSKLVPPSFLFFCFSSSVSHHFPDHPPL